MVDWSLVDCFVPLFFLCWVILLIFINAKVSVRQFVASPTLIIVIVTGGMTSASLPAVGCVPRSAIITNRCS